MKKSSAESVPIDAAASETELICVAACGCVPIFIPETELASFYEGVRFIAMISVAAALLIALIIR